MPKTRKVLAKKVPKHKWLVCIKCKKPDQSHKQPDGVFYVGTYTTMDCPDCNGPDKKATLCRNCCPTGHQTYPTVKHVKAA